MIQCYATKEADGSFYAPRNMVSVYKDIKNFNVLSDREREKYGQFKCELYNSWYNSLTHVQSTFPECIFDVDRNVVIAFYTLSKLPIKEVILRRCEEVKTLFKSKYWTNEEILFPDGVYRIVQFRDEYDKQILTELAFKTTISDTVELRTEDNIINYLKAVEYLEIYNTVSTNKQKIINISQKHKDSLSMLNDIEEILNYDIEAGW